jgi:predicted metalloprotease with PDZ domain
MPRLPSVFATRLVVARGKAVASLAALRNMTMAGCVAGCLALVSLAASAEVGVGPQPMPYPAPVAAPRDIAFAGTIALAVDATDTRHKVFEVRESIPVQAAGPMTLLYPAWEPASHAETAAVASLAGLVIRADGQRLAWQRDPVNVHAFHIDVPVAARTIDLEFQTITRAADALLLPDSALLQWHRVVLYPAGWFARNIPVAATLRLPPGLHAFSALEVERSVDDRIIYKPTSLETLTDSPVAASRYVQQVNLAPKGAPPFRLDLLAERPGDLAATSDDLAGLRSLIEQAGRVFGAPHYAHYDALVTLSDKFSAGGIEHLESAEDNLPADYFTRPDKQLNNRDLIAHEYVHSWNGRFRQPADLWTPTLNEPMRDSLLWVYEGQTEFWGRVLAARSGMRSTQETLDKLALDAAVVAARPGRSWKSLADSSLDPLSVIGHPMPWRDWQRREDYYPEGVMLWLYVDALIREKSDGRKSLDDFARAFFAIDGSSQITKTYTFDDVCAALNSVTPYDWAGFLRARLDSQKADVLDGLVRDGWQLTFTDTATETFRQDELDAGASNLGYSIGLAVTESGEVRTVAWHGPAFDGPGARRQDPVSQRKAVYARCTGGCGARVRERSDRTRLRGGRAQRERAYSLSRTVALSTAATDRREQGPNRCAVVAAALGNLDDR